MTLVCSNAHTCIHVHAHVALACSHAHAPCVLGRGSLAARGCWAGKVSAAWLVCVEEEGVSHRPGWGGQAGGVFLAGKGLS